LQATFFSARGACLATEVHRDFVGVHLAFHRVGFISTEGGGLGAFFFGGADFGAGGEIDEALEGGELCGGVVAGGGEVGAGVEDGLMSFLEIFVVEGGEEMDVAPSERLEECQGEVFVLGEARVDEVEERNFGVEGAKGLVRDVEAETFGPRFVDAVEDDVVVLAAEPVGELFALGLGEAGEGGLDLWFSHMFRCLEFLVAMVYDEVHVTTEAQRTRGAHRVSLKS
jgi:hypothetical protein